MPLPRLASRSRGIHPMRQLHSINPFAHFASTTFVLLWDGEGQRQLVIGLRSLCDRSTHPQVLEVPPLLSFHLSFRFTTGAGHLILYFPFIYLRTSHTLPIFQIYLLYTPIEMLFNFKTSAILVLMSSLSISSYARPVPVPGTTKAMSKRAFVEQAYNDFQISDGVGGNAEAQANAVFSDNFAGVDLATVSADDLDVINTMAKAAVDAEDTFNSAIDAASGAAADALNVGKIKNKVLKLSGEVLVLQIKQAQGDASAADDLTTEQAKLTKDVAVDVTNAGKPSQSVQFDG